MILDADVEHEIACHTFSHIDCRNEVCSEKVFTDEIHECIQAARKYGISLKSFVHPANMIGNLDTLRKLGFTSYRSSRSGLLDYPEKNSSGLWELPCTAELHYRKPWSLDYHIARYKKIIERAVEHDRLLYLWFHPSVEEEFRDCVIIPLLSHIAELEKEKVARVMTTTSYINFLEHTRRV
jgi:hypothetical protein